MLSIFICCLQSLDLSADRTPGAKTELCQLVLLLPAASFQGFRAFWQTSSDIPSGLYSVQIRLCRYRRQEKPQARNFIPISDISEASASSNLFYLRLFCKKGLSRPAFFSRRPVHAGSILLLCRLIDWMCFGLFLLLCVSFVLFWFGTVLVCRFYSPNQRF